MHDEHDYHFIAKTKEDRDEIFDYLKATFFDLMGYNIPVYGVPKDVKGFVTTKDDLKNKKIKEVNVSY